MGRPKLSDDEKRRRAAERKELKKIKIQEDFKKACEANQTKSLNALTDTAARDSFLNAINFLASDESKRFCLNDLPISIFRQWTTWGSVSEKQIIALNKWFLELQDTIDIAETIQDFFEKDFGLNLVEFHLVLGNIPISSLTEI